MQFVWICRFADLPPFWWQTYKQAHQFFVFSLFSFFVGGRSEGDQIQTSNIIYQVHSLAETVSCRIDNQNVSNFQEIG